ncbi:transcription factor MYB61 [Trifolium repens]|nr:transcription factor MYB61 [Trifolium repens]
MGFQQLEKTKPKHRKGLWSPEEDHNLRNYILKHGHGCWSSVPIKAGLQRNGKKREVQQTRGVDNPDPSSHLRQQVVTNSTTFTRKDRQ